MQHIGLIDFQPGTEWVVRSKDATTITWVHPSGDVASFHYFDLPPDLTAVPDRQGIDVLRQTYREALAGQGGIVSVEAVTMLSVPSVAAIFKLPQTPSGMTYVSSLTIPFRDCSFVVKFQCPERGITGMRDTAIFAKLAASLKIGSDGVPRGWMKDPYLASADDSAKFNLSDQAQYDADFPDHPLSRARRHLNSLSGSVRAVRDLSKIPKFGGPKKSMWKLWPW